MAEFPKIYVHLSEGIVSYRLFRGPAPFSSCSKEAFYYWESMSMLELDLIGYNDADLA